MGNHDYFGDRKAALQLFFGRFPRLECKKWNGFRFQGVGIVPLDSNFGELSDFEEGAQRLWYEATLREFEADPRIHSILVCCHHPPFTNSTAVQDDEEVQGQFVGPFLKASKAKLFFAGHCHAYEHFLVEGKHFVVSGVGGGPRQLLRTDPAERVHVDLFLGGGIREFHFCRVAVWGSQLRVQMVRLEESSELWSAGESFVLE